MYKFLTAAFAASLLTSTAMAGAKVVGTETSDKVEVPKSITIVCSDDVKQGTLVLANPVKINCNDFDLAKSLMATGITVGPDINVNRLMSSLRRVNRQHRNRLRAEYRGRQSGEWNTVSHSYRDRDDWAPRPYRSEKYEGRNSLTEQLAPRENSNRPDLDDFDKKFPGFYRNRGFFVSGTSSCRGWVSLSRILDGECSDSKIRVGPNN